MYTGADLPPESQNGDTLFWSYDTVLPGATSTNVVRVVSQGAEQLGELVDFALKASWYAPDGVTRIDTIFPYQDILLCSYDPNDKQVSPRGVGPSGRVLIGQDLYYTIRFQNTGNYPAQDIEIIDELDEDFELSTFEFLQASHPLTEIKLSGRQLHFIFDDIFLADSVNNEAESHGFVSFKISPRVDLPNNTLVSNMAHIYFDQNPPIITSTTQNPFTQSIETNIHSVADPSTPFLLYPNPASQPFYIQVLDNAILPIPLTLYNARGERVFREVLLRDRQRINTASLPSGFHFIELDGKQMKKIIIH